MSRDDPRLNAIEITIAQGDEQPCVDDIAQALLLALSGGNLNAYAKTVAERIEGKAGNALGADLHRRRIPRVPGEAGSAVHDSDSASR